VKKDELDVTDMIRNDPGFQRFMRESIVPVWCTEADEPIPVDLPEDEQVELVYKHMYISDANDAYAWVVGLERGEQIVGMRIGDFMPRSTPENLASVQQLVRARYNLQDMETTESYRDGEWRVYLNSHVGVIEDGKYLRGWGTSRDITSYKTAIKELRESELRYRIVSDFTYDWESWEEPDGSYNYVSPAFERITGYGVHELISRPEFMDEIVFPDDLATWQTHHRAAHTRRETAEIQFRIRTKDGQIRWIEHICQPVYDEEGVHLGVRASNRDITERKKMAEKLEQQLAEIKQLKNRLEAESAYLQNEIRLEHDFENIIGESEALKYVLHRVEQVAPTDSPVLIMGETGTGKELLARALHKLSSRGKRALVKVNCAALPAQLIESELFGREKGAYTDATMTQPGRFELAKGSTLFLDEIGELPLELQAKLLRVLESGEFERLGSPRTLHSDARIIAATNRVLEEEVREGRFREDLWYRLKVFPITVPPLREHPEDIPLLVQWFVDQHARKMGKGAAEIPKRTMEMLQRYPWPGNVRELEHAVESALITAQGKKLNFELPEIADSVLSDFKPFEEMERDYILRVLKAKDWKVGGDNSAASTLGMHVNTLRGRMKKLGIKRPKAR
jgi:PAS domain S-box-containing protein